MKLPKDIPIYIAATATQYAWERMEAEPILDTPIKLAQAVAHMVWAEAVALSEREDHK